MGIPENGLRKSTAHRFSKYKYKPQFSIRMEVVARVAATKKTGYDAIRLEWKDRSESGIDESVLRQAYRDCIL